MTSQQKSTNGKAHPVFHYRDKWSFISGFLGFLVVSIWTTGFADYIAQEGVKKSEGIVEDVLCEGARNQQSFRVIPSTGPEFLIGIGRCKNYDMNSLIGNRFYTYYHVDSPELPIEVKIGDEFGYDEGWNRSDIIAAIIFSAFGAYIGFMGHCLYRKNNSEKRRAK